MGGNLARKSQDGVIAAIEERRNLDLEGRIVKDGVRKALRDRQLALAELVHAIREHQKTADGKPLTLLGSEYLQAVHD